MNIENFNIAAGANVNIISDCSVNIANGKTEKVASKSEDARIIEIADEAELIDEPKQELLDEETQAVLEKGRPYFEDAIDEGLMRKTETGYEWLVKSKVLLAYFCGRIYCDDYVKLYKGETTWKSGGKTFPDKILSTLFNMPNLGTSRRKQLEGSAPYGYKKIDVLID